MSPDLERELQAIFYQRRQRVRERLGKIAQRVSRTRQRLQQDTTDVIETRGLCRDVGRRGHTGD